jgi:hypothetical protein
VRAGSDSDIADEIEKIVEWVKASTAHELELEEVGAHALLQHYSLPTELVDFTSNLDVAATFANDGRRDGEGCIGVLDLNIAIRQLTIFNLTVLQLAERAIRQDAFGVPLPCLAAMAKIAACLSLPNSSTVMHPHSRTCGNTKSYCKEDWHGMAIA